MNDWTRPTDPSIEDINNTTGFLNYFHFLEGGLSHGGKRAMLLPDYKLLCVKVEEYIMKTFPDYKTLYIGDYNDLNYLLITIWSRIQNLDHSSDHYPVIDSDFNYTFFQKSIDNYRKPLKEIRLQFHQKQYEKKINAPIIRVYTALKSTAQEIGTISKKIDNEILQLIKMENNLEKARQLALLLTLKASTGVLNSICIASSFLGPMNAVASAAGGLIVRNLDGYKLLIDGAQQLANSVKNLYSLERESLRDYFSKSNIDEIEESPEVKELIKKDEDFQNIKKNVDNFIKLLDQKSLAENDYWQKKKRTKEELDQYHRKLLSSVSSLEKEIDKKKVFALIKWIERVKMIITVAESGIKDYNQAKDIISNAGVKQINDTIDRLKECEYIIIAPLLPIIDTIQANMTDVLQNSVHKPRAVFYKNRQMLQNLIRDFQEKVKLITPISTTNSSFSQNIAVCVENLLYEMSITAQIYNHIQNYIAQIRLADYFANLNFEIDSSSNSSLNSTIGKLQLQTRTNLVAQEYQTAVDICKIYLFPYVNRFSYIHIDTLFNNLQEPYNVMDVAASYMEDLISNCGKEYWPLDGGLGPSSFRVLFSEFAEGRIHKYFFLWRHETYHNEISALLQLRPITLMADITQILQKYMHVIKFNEIGIRFLSSNKTLQNELDKIMAYFLVTMTHLGDSYYKCGNKYYVTDHTDISMTHSVNTFNDSLIYHNYSLLLYHDHDSASLEIKNHMTTFSPYASWKIALQPNEKQKIPPQEDQRLREIASNYKQIDLALEGHSTVYYAEPRFCRMDLEKYYKLVGTYPMPPPRPPSSPPPKVVQDSYSHNPNAPFDTNSANGIKSSINNAINWLTNIVGFYKSIWISNGMRFNLAENASPSKSMYSILFDSRSTEDYASIAEIGVKFNLHGSLTLADFIIRWLTKEKPYNNDANESISLIEIRAFVLNFVERVENLIPSVDIVGESAVQLDPLALISRLEKQLIINQNTTAISNVLYQSIVDANPNLDRSPLSYIVRQKIIEMMIH